MKKINIYMVLMWLGMGGIISACPITIKNDIPLINVHIVNLRTQKDTVGHEILLVPQAETTFGSDKEHALFLIKDGFKHYKVIQKSCLKGQSIVIKVSEVRDNTLPAHLKGLFTIIKREKLLSPKMP